jgi:hypothetical protein
MALVNQILPMTGPPVSFPQPRISAAWARWMFALVATMLPNPAAAQSDAVIQGRVVARGGSPEVDGARVELEGHGVTETSALGTFRFEGVAPGNYTLRVTGVGYAPAIMRLAIRGDTTVTVRLEPVPFRLDSLTVTARRIDVEGLAQDTVMDLPLRDADVFTSYAPSTRTNRHGRFRLTDVWEGNPIAVTVAAFGYLPLDTIVEPMAGDRYVLNLARDLVVEKMIAHQVERIEQRAAGRLSVLMRPLDRDALLRSGGVSLRDVLRAKYSIHLRRLRCVLVDDKQLPPAVDGPMLGTMHPEDIQRVEVLFNGAMLRIYTREFIRRMIGRQVDLRAPVYVNIANPPVCH